MPIFPAPGSVFASFLKATFKLLDDYYDSIIFELKSQDIHLMCLIPLLNFI